jgi:hypothetical protein
VLQMFRRAYVSGDQLIFVSWSVDPISTIFQVNRVNRGIIRKELHRFIFRSELSYDS